MIKKLFKNFKSLFYIVSIIFKCSPKYGFIYFVLYILEGILGGINIIYTAKLIEAISKVTLYNNYQECFVQAAILIGLLLVKYINSDLEELFKVKIENSLRQTLVISINEKKSKLLYKYFEDSKINDLMYRISDSIEEKCTEAFHMILLFITICIRVINIVIIISLKLKLTSLLLIVLIIPVFILCFKRGLILYEAMKDANVYERRYRYIGDILSQRESASERRLFAYSKGVNKWWKKEYEQCCTKKNNGELKYKNNMFIISFFSTILCILIILVLLVMIKFKIIEISLVLALVISLYDLIGVMTWEFTEAVSEVSTFIRTVEDLCIFYDLEEEKNVMELNAHDKLDFKVIEFKNVSFKYPNKDKYTINNLSFIIEKNKYYAFVGINGVGKTTILKLMLGLYKDYEGQILIDKKELRCFENYQLRKLFSVIFQDYSRYSISLKDNIALGEYHEEDMNETIENFGMNHMIKNLKYGLDTKLGKLDSDSVDLSGGQWQKIALARCFINNAPIKILDEPTAAIDPLLEAEIYNNFNEISKGNTTILITHRLGAIRKCDCIYVLDQGHVIEYGTHEELIKLGQHYSNMYEKQRSWYE